MICSFSNFLDFFLFLKVLCPGRKKSGFRTVRTLKICRTSGRALVHFIEQLILRIPNFNFPNLRCCKVFLSFQYKELFWHFWVYYDVNLKLLPCKNTQRVKKQKNCCKNLGFALVVRMSWTRNIAWNFIKM